MSRATACLATLLLLPAMALSAFAQHGGHGNPGGGPQIVSPALSTDSAIYRVGQPVTITLRNVTDASTVINGRPVFHIAAPQNAEVAYNFPGGQSTVTLRPGSAPIEWIWDQRIVLPGATMATAAPVGRYAVHAAYRARSTDPWQHLEATFQIVPANDGQVVLRTARASYRRGTAVSFTLTNRSNRTISFRSVAPWRIERQRNGSFSDYSGPGPVILMVPPPLAANQSESWSWNGRLENSNTSAAVGRYRVVVTYTTQVPNVVPGLPQPQRVESNLFRINR